MINKLRMNNPFIEMNFIDFNINSNVFFPKKNIYSSYN